MLERPATPDVYPPGLYTGSAGIAWAFWEAGLQDVALQTMRAADNHPLLWKVSDLFYGSAGYGLSCLHFAGATGAQEWLDKAVLVGEHLLEVKNIDENGDYFWEDDQGDAWMGYARGASGIALYLLYLSLATGEQRFLEAGRRALSFDLTHLETTEEGFLIFPRGPRGTLSKVLTHYWFDGSAGVLTSLVRFWAHTRDEDYRAILDMLAPDVMRKYTAFPGLFLGLSGLGNALLDLADFTGEEQYRQAAHRTASGALLYALQRPTGIAFPGEQLLRISTDFGTGSAGIALFLNRLVNQEQRPGNFNFTLDTLLSEHGSHRGEETAVAEPVSAGRN
jgi:lantibiotic modifying enzyme